MSDHLIQANSTGNFVTVKPRSSSTGNLLTGLTYSSFTCTYQRSGSATATTVTLSAGTLGTYSSGSIVETAQGGTYQFCPPNAAVAAGAAEVDFKFSSSSTLDATEHVILTGQVNALPTVDANNNVHGIQSRSVSDGSTIGTSTPTTAQTISETTSSGNTLKVDARRLPRNADEGRLVYSQNTWAALTDFTITGTAPTITAAGAIRLNPSTVGNFDGQALELNGVVSASNNYDIDVTFTVVALGATAYGVAIGRRSVNTWYPVSVAAHVNPSAAPNQLLVWPQATGAPAGFVGSENITQVMAVGDQVRIRASQRGPLFSVAIENITQKIVDRYAVLNSLAPGTSFHTPNTSTFRIFGLGGTFDVTSIQIVDRSPQFPLIACVGNSKTSGFSAGSIQATWAYLLNSFGPCVNFGGEGDRTVEVMQRLADITSAPPRYVVLNIGRNDLAASVPTATWQANYQTIVTALKNVGCVVIHLLPIPETIESNQSALTTYINSTYPSDLKIDVTSQWVNATDLATDGVHPNAAGHLLIYKAIVASGYIAPDNRMATQVGNLPTDYQQRGAAVTLPALPNVTVGGYAAGEDPATLLLSNPTYKLTTDANGRIGVNNFPVEFLSSAEQTELTTTINDLNALLGRSDTAGTVSTISANVATLLTRISGSLTIANGKVAATMAAGDVTGNLPVIVNAYAAGEDPGTLLSTQFAALSQGLSSVPNAAAIQAATAAAIAATPAKLPATPPTGYGGYIPAGPGANACTIPLTASGQPWVGATVYITADAAGLKSVAGPLVTNSAGEVTALLTIGVTYYLWAEGTGNNPIEAYAFVAA